MINAILGQLKKKRSSNSLLCISSLTLKKKESAHGKGALGGQEVGGEEGRASARSPAAGTRAGRQGPGRSCRSPRGTAGRGGAAQMGVLGPACHLLIKKRK